jgi:hypothetical protein
MKKYLDDKCKKQKWKYAEGYIVGTKTSKSVPISIFNYGNKSEIICKYGRRLSEKRY